MLPYKEALDLIVSSGKTLPAEKVELNDSLHRILAVDVFYDMDMPPFDKSAMDGYACRRAELTNELEVVETIYAGKLPEQKLQKNQCYKIMTGAVIPEEADCVFKKEDAEVTASGRVRCRNLQTGNNICYQGEDVRSGQKVLGKSTRLTPKHLPVLAGAGVVQPVVYKRPKVSVFATGTELVEPGAQPLSYQIRNSNSSQLLAQLREMNVAALYGGIIGDEESLLAEKMTQALKESQVILLTGGVSVGDYDFMPDVLAKLDFEILVTSTAIKPGKPMVFARKGEKYCFGLSGNPVSSFIQFELYVKPFLFALMNYRFQPQIFRFPMGKDVSRKKADRLSFLPVVLSPEMEVVPLEFHGSAHIHAIAGASFLLEVPQGVNHIKKGELVNVRSI